MVINIKDAWYGPRKLIREFQSKLIKRKRSSNIENVLEWKMIHFIHFFV